MTSAQVVLIAIGAVALAESTWGISAPDRLRDAVRVATSGAPERSLGIAGLFAGLAALMWILMSAEERLSDWALLLLSWIFAGAALANAKRQGFSSLMDFMILRRSAWAIRLFYTAEFAVACGLIALGVSGA